VPKALLMILMLLWRVIGMRTKMMTGRVVIIFVHERIVNVMNTDIFVPDVLNILTLNVANMQNWIKHY